MQTPSKVHPPVGQQVIIYTGRLAEIKGIHHLLEALSELKKLRKAGSAGSLEMEIKKLS